MIKPIIIYSGISHVLCFVRFLQSGFFAGFGRFFTALLIALACGSRLIEFLHHHQSKGQPIREDGPQSHLLTKKEPPPWADCLFSAAAFSVRYFGLI